MKKNMVITCSVILVLSGCAAEQPKVDANTELMAIRKAAFQKASTAASDYAICTSLTAIVQKKMTNTSILDNAEIVLAKCSDKLNFYGMYLENYYFAISPNNYIEKASIDVNKLQQQTRNNVIKQLAE